MHMRVHEPYGVFQSVYIADDDGMQALRSFTHRLEIAVTDIRHTPEYRHLLHSILRHDSHHRTRADKCCWVSGAPPDLVHKVSLHQTEGLTLLVPIDAEQGAPVSLRAGYQSATHQFWGEHVKLVTPTAVMASPCLICPRSLEHDAGECFVGPQCAKALLPALKVGGHEEVLAMFDAPEEGLIETGAPILDTAMLASMLGSTHQRLWWLVTTVYTEQYKVFTIKKKSGGARSIHNPSPALRKVQRVLLHRLLDPVEVGTCVGAYVKGRGLSHTSEQHVGAKVLVKMDLTNFFGSTRKRWVREVFEAQGHTKQVCEVLATLTTARVPIGGGRVGTGVPQGGITSGSVCNLVATTRVDAPILAALNALDQGWTYTRYADDLALSTKQDLTREEVDEVVKQVKACIKASGYRTNHKKTHIVRSTAVHKPMRVLGHSVHTHVNIPRDTYRLLRARVHHVITGRAQSDASLLGELNYWNHICGKKIAPLLSKLTKHTETLART
jgi:RNA-directed DNA polymerase